MDNWPICYECNFAVESYEKVHEGSRSIDIRARCHGKEEVLKISWEHWSSVMPPADVLSNQIASLVFFEPVEDGGYGAAGV